MPEQKKLPLIVISGPTASGKTALGISVAKAVSGEVVSADSMQLYKGIEIATAAPTREEMCGIPHHLISFLDVGTGFSVADYCNLAHKTIADIVSRGRMPVLVGGTGLYINSVVDNISFKAVKETDIRAKLNERLQKDGVDQLYCELCKVDRAAAERIEKNNTRRIIRALEVYYVTGETFSHLNELSREAPSRYDYLWFNISFKSRENLYERINTRVDKMIENGLVEEAEKFRLQTLENGAGQAIGHKEIYPYLDGKITLDTAVENLKMATRRYAKRQITWFKRRNDTIPLLADCESISEKAINILKESRKYE